MKTIRIIAVLVFIISAFRASAQTSYGCVNGSCFAYGVYRHDCGDRYHERCERRDRCHDRRDLRQDARLRREYLREGDYRDARRVSRDMYRDRRDLR